MFWQLFRCIQQHMDHYFLSFNSCPFNSQIRPFYVKWKLFIWEKMWTMANPQTHGASEAVKTPYFQRSQTEPKQECVICSYWSPLSHWGWNVRHLIFLSLRQWIKCVKQLQIPVIWMEMLRVMTSTLKRDVPQLFLRKLRHFIQTCSESLTQKVIYLWYMYFW